VLHESDVDRSGARPDDLSVLRRQGSEMVINMQTAKMLGLPVRQDILIPSDDLLKANHFR
jgi:hypothetical protein